MPKIHKKDVPSIPTQNTLKQISDLDLAVSRRPKVELKIPKIPTLPNKPRRPDKILTQGPIALEVDNLLRSNTLVHCPTMSSNSNPSELAAFTIRKLCWWILKNEKDPADEVNFHPELHDGEIYENGFEPDDDIDDNISIGNVSDSEGNEENLPRKPVVDPDILDEYCGLAGCDMRFRTPFGNLGRGKIRDKDKLTKYIKVKPGSNYEKPNFEAKCFICGERIVGQRQLGAHIRSAFHKDNFRNYSLKYVSSEFSQEISVKVAPKVFPAKLIKYTVQDAITAPPVIEGQKTEKFNLEVGVGIEIEQPDSPMAVIDSNESTSDIVLIDLENDDLSLPDISLYDLEPDDEQINAKIFLRKNGLWTDSMEKKWFQMLQQETRITAKYNDMREKYIDAPESHPMKNLEWEKFWERRSLEVEAEGKDPNTHDYGADWIPFWFKRMQEIMKSLVMEELLKMKQQLGLDTVTLKNVCLQLGNKALRGNDTSTSSRRQETRHESKYKSHDSSKKYDDRHKSNYRENSIESSRKQNYRQDSNYRKTSVNYSRKYDDRHGPKFQKTSHDYSRKREGGQGSKISKYVNAPSSRHHWNNERSQSKEYSKPAWTKPRPSAGQNFNKDKHSWNSKSKHCNPRAPPPAPHLPPFELEISNWGAVEEENWEK